MSVGKIRDGNAKNDKNHSSPFDFVGFSNQLGEEYFNSKQDSRISWFPVQLKDDADYSSCSKDEEIICENTSSTREEDEQIMQVGSQFVGEDDFDDTSNRRSSTSHQIHSKGFGQEPKTQSSELGKSLSTVHRKYRRTKMVGRVLSTEKWVTHTTSFGKGAKNIDPRRRLRHRVGGKLTGNANIGLLARVRKRKFHQCSGAKDDLLCTEDARRKIQKLDNKDPIGQHDSFKMHNKSRRYRLYRSTNISHRYTTNMQRFQLGCAVQLYTGDSEHKSRSTESIETSSIRSGTTTPIIQHDSRPMGSSDDRRFCGKAQHKNKEVLESTSRSGCSSSGRVPPEMAEEGTLLTSTVENDPKGNSQVSTVEDQQRSIGDAILVPNDPKNETLDTTAADEHQQLDSGRMALIYKSGKRDSINDKTTTFLFKATRQSTHKAYNNGWKVWSNWCRSQNPKLEPEEYSPNNVFQFLVDNQHFSYQYLNGLRSSIASVFQHIHPHQKPIASQPNISRFFTAKRKTEIRIPTTSQLETWDINLLIQFIKDKLSPTAELNLQQLQLKVILLTCINTMGRPRSDVGRLQHRDVKFITSEISNDLEGVVLHIRTPKESQVRTSKLGMVDDKEVCLVSTLFVFMHKTKGCRVHLPEDHTLFLSYIQHHTKPPSSVRTATVGKWIHEAMKEAGVNPVFKAHSIRSASSTKAVMLGTPIDKVKEHADWSLKSNTFEKYYYKPHQRLHQSTAIQNSIFLSAEKRITLKVEAESTRIVLGTTNNTKVDEAKTENVIHTRPWYRKYF